LPLPSQEGVFYVRIIQNHEKIPPHLREDYEKPYAISRSARDDFSYPR